MAFLAQVSTQRLIVDTISANTLKLSTITVSTVTADYFIGDGSFLTNVGGGIDSSQLVSTVTGLQLYTDTSISSFSTALGFISGGGVSFETLTSTIEGLGTLGYISSFDLLSTVAGVELYTDTSISSFSTALGFVGGGGILTLPLYLSTETVYTSSLVAVSATISSLTVDNLIFGDGNGWAYFGAIQAVAVSSIQINTATLYASSIQADYFIGDGSLLSNVGLNPNQLQSTIDGLGTAGYISSFQLFSTVEGLGSAGYISSLDLVSTIDGLGSAGYISSLDLVSTVVGLELYTNTSISSFSTALGYIGGGGGGIAAIPLYLSTETVFTSSLVAVSASISSLTVDNLIFGDGNGWAYFGAIQAVAVSSIQMNTATLYASSIQADYFIGDGSLLSNVVGGITSVQLVSTVAGLELYTDTSISSFSTALGFIGGGGGDVTTASLLSTVQGLGSSDYVSTLSLVSTTIDITNSYGAGLSSLSTFITNLPGYQGQLLYMNQTTTVAPYKQLSPYENISTLQSTITSLPGNTTSNLLAAFQSDFPLPAFIPNGIWDMNLFAIAEITGPLSFFYTLNTRAPDTSELLLYKSQTVPVTNSGIQQYTNSIAVTYTPLPQASTLVVKLYGSNSAAPTRNLSCYFQDNYYSHIHTSFNNAQESGASGVSSLSTVVGQNYSFFSSQFVSTNNNLFSTVSGLGSSGYISTSQLTSTVTGLGTTSGYIATSQLTSTVTGLGTLGYLSSISLFIQTITF